LTVAYTFLEHDGADEMKADPSHRPGAATHILCVDDDPDILRVLRYALEDAGFEVGEATGAEEALSWIERHGLPHLALVDIRLPGLDGLELCRRLLAYSDLPVILLTAVDDEPTVVRSLETVA